jgi:hypothetical protein
LREGAEGEIGLLSAACERTHLHVYAGGAIRF